MKGRVEVVKTNLEARFSWIPDDDGREHDTTALRKLLFAADIKVDVSDDVLESALDFFSKTTDKAETEPIARGVPPAAPTPLTAEIGGADLPNTVKRAIEDLFRDWPSADEEPFFAWADEGAIVGRITPAIPARPGLTLNHEPIPPPESEGEAFRVGEHLEIRGNDLIALSDGVLRIVPGGTDLRPCRLHDWSIHGGTDEGGCFLTYAPGDALLAPPPPAEIVNAAWNLGYTAEKIVSQDEIRTLIATAMDDQIPLFNYPISRDTDGEIRLEVDSGRIRADLKIRKATGEGKAPALNDIAAAIRNSGLRGLDGTRVKADIMTFWKSDLLCGSIRLKEGILPEREANRELEYQVPFLDEDEASSIRARLEVKSERTKGLASLRVFPPQAVSKMARVKKNQVVGRLGSVKKGKPGRDIDGNPLPAYPGNDPDITIHENLRWEGDTVVSLIEGLMDIGATHNGRTHLRVRAHLDASILVTISEDRIKAFVSTRLPVGTGAPVDGDRIRRAAQEAGVVKGLLEDALEDIAVRTLTGEMVTGHLIAEGHLPMKDNARLSLLISGDPAVVPVPVKAEDRVGRLSTGEESGWNVLGEALLEEGASITEGDNIRREKDENGKTFLVADKSGHLMMREGTLFVKHFLNHVGDVSPASGNIRFPGRIKIDGSVLSRVVVDGGEGVEITEVVQAALVNSGGDISIGKGIKGGKNAVIRSKGNLSLSYAEEANLLITGNIAADRALMNCRVKCNGRLEISDSGKLIGGVMKLKKGLVCREVGNGRGVETTISFGQDYLVGSQIDQTREEMAKIQGFLEKIDKMMMEFERKGESRKLIMIRQKKVDALKMLEKKNIRLFLLREKFERHFPSEIRITGTAWPGTTFESHGRLLKIDAPAQSFLVRFNPEKGCLERRSL